MNIIMSAINAILELFHICCDLKYNNVLFSVQICWYGYVSTHIFFWSHCSPHMSIFCHVLHAHDDNDNEQ